jgi:lantibiotic leader peptide-processing serine protease
MHLRRVLVGLSAASLLAAFSVAGPVGATGAVQTYLIVYSGSAVPSDAASRIAAAGGSVVASYGAIGVVVARSDSPTFRSSVTLDRRIAGASATASFATQLADDVGSTAGTTDTPQAGAPAPGSDSLSGLQWDMDQIHAPEARAVNGGSSSVLVGDIDTGLDYTHPDLAANVDDAASVNCVSGVPVPGKVAAMDDNGHGTHTAGTIAAARNGIGIVGVAPNVRIAGIKAGNAAGFFFPEAVVCAFMWPARTT